MTTRVMLITPTNTIPLLKVRNALAKLFHNTSAFMSESHVGALVVQICAAETGVCDADENLAVLDFAGRFGFDDFAAFAAFEDCEFDHF